MAISELVTAGMGSVNPVLTGASLVAPMISNFRQARQNPTRRPQTPFGISTRDYNYNSRDLPHSVFFELGGRMGAVQPMRSAPQSVKNYPGGQLEPVSSNAMQAQGRTHQEGGIQLPFGEIEDDEIIVDSPITGETQVHSDMLGYAEETERLSEFKGQLEQAMVAKQEKLATLMSEVDRLSAEHGTTQDKIKRNGLKRSMEKAASYAQQIEQEMLTLQNEIHTVDSQIEELFQMQEMETAMMGAGEQEMYQLGGGVRRNVDRFIRDQDRAALDLEIDPLGNLDPVTITPTTRDRHMVDHPQPYVGPTRSSGFRQPSEIRDLEHIGPDENPLAYTPTRDVFGDMRRRARKLGTRTTETTETSTNIPVGVIHGSEIFDAPGSTDTTPIPLRSLDTPRPTSQATPTPQAKPTQTVSPASTPAISSSPQGGSVLDVNEAIPRFTDGIPMMGRYTPVSHRQTDAPTKPSIETQGLSEEQSRFGIEDIMPYADNITNLLLNSIIGRTPTPEYSRQAVPTMDANYNINPQLHQLDSDKAAMREFIRGNVSSAPVARAAHSGITADAQRRVGEMWAEKHNQEAAIRNRNAILAAQVEGANIERDFVNQAADYDRRVGMLEGISQNVANAISKYNLGKTQDQQLGLAKLLAGQNEGIFREIASALGRGDNNQIRKILEGTDLTPEQIEEAITLLN